MTAAKKENPSAWKPAKKQAGSKNHRPFQKKPPARTAAPAREADEKHVVVARPPVSKLPPNYQSLRFRPGVHTKSAAGEKKRETRSDFGAPIEAFIQKLRSPSREICDALTAVVESAVPDAVSEIKWGMPVFRNTRLLCYLRPAATYVRFGFYDHGELLHDPRRRLEGTGKMRHIKLKKLEDIDRPMFLGWVKTAAKMNEVD